MPKGSMTCRLCKQSYSLFKTAGDSKWSKVCPDCVDWTSISREVLLKIMAEVAEAEKDTKSIS
jgi:hypothetical protein